MSVLLTMVDASTFAEILLDLIIVHVIKVGEIPALSNSSAVGNKRTGWKIPPILINVQHRINIKGGKIPNKRTG